MFFSPQLILQFYRGALMIFFQGKPMLFQGSRGSNIFQGREGGGSNFFREVGVQLLIPMEPIILVIF